MPRPNHSPHLDLPNIVWWWVQIMKLPTVQISPFSRYLIPLLVYFNLCFPRQQAGGQKTLNRMAASIPRI
jgi:hypothetical protein